jgi:16S rRNA (guanine(966)-N(2))-methyltransferase RsmD
MAGAGRVVAGSARGVHLVAPGPGTRPLADRVKQAVFGALAPLLEGCAVLDVCAGSGAAAVEALSRGAARAVLVERDRGAAQAIAENLRRAGVAERAVVVRREALAALRDLAAAGDRFDLAVVDPPYDDTSLRDAILARLGAPDGPLAAGATVVVTAHWRDLPAEAIGLLRSTRVRRFGETAITFYRRDAGGIAAAG